MSKLAYSIFTFLGSCVFAQASVITSLYSTGQDNLHNLLAGGAVDPHYKLVAQLTGNQAPYGPNGFVTNQDGFPLTNIWTPNLPTAQWIEPGSGSLDTHAYGIYFWETSFDLTGYDPTTAIVTLNIAADDIVRTISLNGTNKFFNVGNKSSMTGPLTMMTGFNPGINTIRFVVQNGLSNISLNPTGLLVDARGTARLVPEPATLLVSALAIGTIAKRRRKQRS